jgi:hypothetical protein
MGFALSLHASVPTANVAPGLKRAAEVTSAIPFEQAVATHGRPALALTATPADVSFYDEFYPVHGDLQSAQTPAQTTSQTKTGALHWFASLFKKTVKRVSFI